VVDGLPEETIHEPQLGFVKCSNPPTTYLCIPGLPRILVFSLLIRIPTTIPNLGHAIFAS
jgi:hypothetical protein